jgi:tRNA(fMet)-specific endonuclease VapC
VGFVVDISVFIDLERAEISIEARFGDDEVYLAAVSASELLHGVYRANTALRRARREKYVENILRAIPILNFDLDTARVYAQIGADLRASGHKVGAHDLQIAATALHHGLTLLTANVRDFERIPGLAVQRW